MSADVDHTKPFTQPPSFNLAAYRAQLDRLASGAPSSTDRLLWCVECGVSVDPMTGQTNPGGHHGPGASLDPDCAACAIMGRARPT